MAAPARAGHALAQTKLHETYAVRTFLAIAAPSATTIRSNKSFFTKFLLGAGQASAA